MIVAAGGYSGSFSGPSGGVTYSDGKWGAVGGYSSMSGSMRSELAQLLFPPQEPQKKFGTPNCGEMVVVIIIGILGITGFFIESVRNEILALWILIGTIPAIMFYAICLDLKIKANYRKEKPKWDRAMAKWERLYFCSRDGVVFDPKSQKTCRPDELISFIYSRQKQNSD